ncbi:MAG TPA: MarR family transcriptional regulator [Devosia sp.]|nr:MarR family transcriptional regulator [Devosia sp.]
MGEFDQHQTLAFQAAALARHLAIRLRDALIPLGLMPAQFSALVEIGRAEGMTQKELVDRLDVEQPGVARTLNSLEADGWIERRAKAGRSQGLFLTERARMVLPRAVETAARVNREALSELSRTERDLLIDQIDELVSGLRTG